MGQFSMEICPEVGHFSMKLNTPCNWRFAGCTCGAPSTNSMPRPGRRSRPNFLHMWPAYMPSKQRYAAIPPNTGSRCGVREVGRLLRHCTTGCTISCRASPARPIWRRPCAMRHDIGPALWPSSTMGVSRWTRTRSNASFGQLRCVFHCTPPFQVFVNIGSVLASAERHGRPFRAIALFTGSDVRSSARIW